MIVIAGFFILPLVVAAAFVGAVARAGRRLGESLAVRRLRTLRVASALIGWMMLTALVAQSGVLRRFDATPPPFMVFMLAVVAIGVGLSFSPLGTMLVRSLPLSVLVGSQVFRLPLELLMHRAYRDGLMPVQMSWSGRNFDIVSGITAGALGLWLRRREAGRRELPRRVVVAWNALGSLLLVNIVVVAVLSTPRFAWFGPDRLNTFVTYPPYVWLPAVLVMAALVGHLLVWRRLLRRWSSGGTRVGREDC